MIAATDGKGAGRREVAARQTAWAMSLARGLAHTGATPNAISVASVFFAALAGGCLALSSSAGGWRVSALFAAAAVLIQLRLLCNLFDGMVAIEFGRQTRTGSLFNDLPDRFADAAIFVGCGYAACGVPYAVALGWAAALLALLTAYVRVLGAASGAKPCFLGPMAKQHRMAVVTAAVVTAAAWRGPARWILAVALALIVVGCVVTVARRLRVVMRELEGA
jgi:phosphatidylglycerophosphate synthase